MNYFSSEDMDCVCYIEEKTNNVVIKFFGMDNQDSAELFTIYVMNRLGFEYNSLSYEMPSKSVHWYMATKLKPKDNKFHKGNGDDGKHYWLTPDDLMKELNDEFKFDFDPCPYPKPEDFDGLTNEWGKSNYVNPPFGSIIHQGKKKGPTAWVRKAIAEHEKGKDVVLVYPIDKWILMMIKAGAEIRNLGDVKWLATEDKSQGKGTGRHIACFVLKK